MRQDFQSFYLRTRDDGVADDENQARYCEDARNPTVCFSNDESGKTEEPHQVVGFGD